MLNKTDYRLQIPPNTSQNEYSVCSDIFSFAVTLWEIMSLCSQRPFHDLSDQQLLDAAASATSSSSLCRLCLPALCPSEMSDLLNECHRYEPDRRPRFRDIHVFLARKNVGHAPPYPSM